MPRIQWNVSRNVVRDFDRENRYEPYDGPIPPNSVYRWKIVKLAYAAEDGNKTEQIRPLLVLVPRTKEEKRYGGYAIMCFLNVADNTDFVWVPFLDAIGVTDREFFDQAIMDEQGNIKKIGRWRMDPNNPTEIMARLADNEWIDKHGEEKTGKRIDWFGAVKDSTVDDEESYEDTDDFEEEAPKRTRRTPASRRNAGRVARRRPRATLEVEDEGGFDDDDF